ncbi:rho GTPase-activating protein 24-like isoform X3 [Bolinopsis microptera]|uniref:rho GTPase-activating protein 24-like isoform X3 n=1 Tax=Bolinopsis microptera TaxID=2820187 RepID=UPI00307A5F0B
MSMANITTGWLKKETHGTLRRYERRWVVVSGNSLSYFKKDDNSNPSLGIIDLPGKKIVQNPDTDHGFKFELTDKESSYNFSCETKTEREKWVDAISCISYGPFGGGMFGSSIEVTVKREKLHGGRNVPKIISQCIGYLDNSFRLKENGIFRLPGNEKTVKQLKMEFQEGMEPNLEAKGDTHTIGSLLKLYLRSLPDSVIPSSLYEDFVAIILTYELNQQEGLNELRYLINRIPCSAYNCIRRLCEFLFKVQTYSDSNRMDLNNLAIVFSPTILKNNSGNLDLEMRDIQKLKKVTEMMILNHETLFPADKEEEDQEDLDLENIDPDELKNLFTVKMIKYQVQSREILTKDKEIAALRAQLAQSQQTVEHQEHTIIEQQNKLDHLGGCVQRLENQVTNYKATLSAGKL